MNRRPGESVLSRSAFPTDARANTAYALSLTGLGVWMLQTYAFHGQLPGPVAAALYTFVPAGVGWFASHYTRQKTQIDELVQQAVEKRAPGGTCSE